MRVFKFFSATTLLMLPVTYANASGFEANWDMNLRALSGYDFSNHTSSDVQKKYAFPAHSDVAGHILYDFDEKTSLGLYAKLLGQSGVYLDNLNQGNWGEEIYAVFSSKFGDFELGQMPNAATTLAVHQPNFSTFQPLPVDLANFIRSPNWQQHKHLKFYNVLTSTIPDADGSALKLSYYTPEILGLTLALSLTPETNANDGLISKFSPYHNESALTLVAYRTYDFEGFQTDSFLSFAHYERSHQDFAGGLSLYRKGWTLFGSYRETHPHHYNISSSLTPNVLYVDGWRHARAWNAGVGYEFAFWNTSVSYFESESLENSAKNSLWNWHNAFRFDQNYAFYTGLFYADYKANREESQNSLHGLGGYLGLEISFWER